MVNNNIKSHNVGTERHKHEFGEGLIYTITDYVFWLFLGNVYFLLLSFPLLYLVLVIGSNGNNELPAGFSTLLFLCCIPVGPAMTALFSVMGKLVRKHDVNITKDFFKAYKANFLQSIFLWTIGLLIIVLLIFDIKIIISYGYPPVLVNILYGVIAFIVIIGLYAFPIISRFYIKTKDVLIFSVYYAIKKIHITFLNVCSFVIVGFVFLKISVFILLFISSIICYSIMFYEQKILTEIEEKIKKDIPEVIQESKLKKAI